MKKIANRSNQRRLLVILGLLFIINFFLFYWPGFPGNLPAISGQLPLNRIPDVHLRFSPQEVYDFLTQIGPEGRQAFQTMHLTVDLSFPFIYSLFFFLLITLLVDRLNLQTKWLALMPVLAGALDLSENFILNYLAGRYPAYYPNLTILVEFLTIAKFMLLTASILLSAFFVIKFFQISRNA